MMKRFLSLLCALALCLGLLPVTALAAEGAPSSLYVGNQQVISGNDITYWTTGTDGKLTASNESGNWNVKYDPTSATLTLSGATIKGGSDVVSIPYGSGIYALSSSGQPVALTIELIGKNTITGNYGIYVDAQQGGTVGTNASLLIQNSDDDGSLEVSGSSYGIYVKSGTGDASLTIKNASVDAKTTQIYSSYAGVCVQSGASTTDSPNISLSVNGGSLTASASEGNDGIQFYVGNSSASATTSLTVSENAIVDARNGGISASGISETLPTPKPTGENSSGIVFDGSTGTVYGSVILQDDLTIGAGESLTIGQDASLNTGSHEVIVNGGTLTGNVTGEVTYKVTGVSLSKDSLTLDVGGTEDLIATITPETATDKNLTWASDAEGVATVDQNGKVNAVAPGTANITVTTQDGSHTATCAVTVTKPVTGVTLDPTSLSLFTGDTATLTATVEPENATNKNVTWSSDKPEVATVENGKVTAKAAGTATITATAEDDSNISATCTVTVTQSEYSISADTTALDFGSAYTGYTQPAAKTVTITNTGNRPQPLTLTASTGSFEVGTLTKTQLAAGEKATFTVQPKAGLAVGTYSEDIAVSGTGDAAVTIAATFTVRRYVPPAPAKTPSQQALDKIGAADDGDTVTVSLSAGDTVLDAEVFEALAGKDVTLVVAVPGGVTWAVSGQDIPKNAKLSDLDLGVSLGGGIPADVINAVTGEAGTVQLSLAHDGAFGFEMTLTAPLGEGRAGLWANLYHYDEGTGRLVFQSASTVGADGRASFALSHASEWAVVVDSASHELPFSDVAPADWFANPVGEAYRAGVMMGYGDGSGLFGPDDELTRAQAAAVLFRALGQEAQAPSCGMTDVDQDAWYAGAVDWAVHSGLMRGYGDGSGPFGPDDALSREQLATVLWRAAGEPDAGAFDPSAFSDGGEASEWAEPALAWAMASGVLQGSDDGDGGVELRPGAAVTRAEMAAMVSRWLAVG